MSLLFRVVFANECTSTHHKLALDALRHLKDEDAQQWQNLFLYSSPIPSCLFMPPNLTPSDDVVDDPSIGPKTAKRLLKVGIATVQELLG